MATLTRYIRRGIAAGGEPSAAGGSGSLADEWLLTNGLGGYAMGCAGGVPARRYHGLLVPSLSPPVRRVVALAATVDTVVLDPGGSGERRLSATTLAFASGARHPDGESKLVEFGADGVVATWRYRLADGVELVRELSVPRGRNAAVLRWSVRTGGRRGVLEVVPLAAMRDFHSLRRESDGGVGVVGANAAGVTLWGRCAERFEMELRAAGASFRSGGVWWREFFYEEERARGQDCVEDLFSPGRFVGALSQGGETVIEMTACVGGPGARGAERSVDADRARRVGFGEAAAASLGPRADTSARSAAFALGAASDDFVVQRMGTGGQATTTVIAGYPWFSDWGRDAMISLPGLMLLTGRHAEALDVLRTFGREQREGIVPNRFDDDDPAIAHYNTADGSLWFVLACLAYADAAGDREAFEDDLLPACLAAVDSYRRGATPLICMDPTDRLIACGNPATQLTWMDAHRDGRTFTPRHGKPVEVNALWYASLRGLAEAMAAGDHRRTHVLDGARARALADEVAASFRHAFWDADRRRLFDRLAPPSPEGRTWTPVEEGRPNQLFAAATPGLLEPEQARAVVDYARERLVTPMGVRTLDPADPGYRGRYEGPLAERDAAYHNGTAWPWLIGVMVDATVAAGGGDERSRDTARGLLDPLISRIDGACPGRLFEVADGDEPQRPGGCPAQAWSVAETLRALVLATQ